MSVQQIDILLTNGYVVTMDGAMRLYPQGSVAIKDNTIVAVGPTADLNGQYEATTVIDCQNCIISPGLINAHTHAVSI